MIPLMPPPSPNFSSPVVTFITSLSTSNNYTTVTWPAVALGTPAAGRYILISVHTDNNGLGPISATIAGVSATAISATANLGLFMALVPAGATGDISITFSGLTGRHVVGVWTVVGLSRSAQNSVTASGTSVVASCSIPSPRGSTVVAAVTHAGGTSVTWAGGVVKRFDLANGNIVRFSAADVSNLPIATQTLTATAPASGAWRITAVALL